MKYATPKQMNEIDSFAIKELGIPGIVLMENAAVNVVGAVTAQLGGSVSGRKILILAGKGNNGGDAFAAARILYEAGAEVSLFVFALKNEIAGDARINYDKLGYTGVKVNELLDEKQIALLDASLSNSEIILDGIFGTGFRGKPEGAYKAAIEAANNSSKPIVSIDIPSGINGETGEVPGVCIKASVTVTFCLPKQGLLLHPGWGVTTISALPSFRMEISLATAFNASASSTSGIRLSLITSLTTVIVASSTDSPGPIAAASILSISLIIRSLHAADRLPLLLSGKGMMTGSVSLVQ